MSTEAAARDYAFAAKTITRARSSTRLPVRRGQLQYEWRHLRRKLAARDPAWLAALGPVARPRAHPLFRVVPGGVEDWERVAPPQKRQGERRRSRPLHRGG